MANKKLPNAGAARILISAVVYDYNIVFYVTNNVSKARVNKIGVKFLVEHAR